MFNFLVSASLRNRLFVLGAALILIVYGAMTLRSLPVDVFPDLNRPTITLVTEAEGLAPEEVELLVTFPLETAMNGMPGVVRVRSVSGAGYRSSTSSSTGARTSSSIGSWSPSG